MNYFTLSGITRFLLFSGAVLFGLRASNLPKEKLDILLASNIACDEMYTKGNAIIGAKGRGTRNIALFVYVSDKTKSLKHLTITGEFACPQNHLLYRAHDNIWSGLV